LENLFRELRRALGLWPLKIFKEGERLFREPGGGIFRERNYSLKSKKKTWGLRILPVLYLFPTFLNPQRKVLQILGARGTQEGEAKFASLLKSNPRGDGVGM